MAFHGSTTPAPRAATPCLAPADVIPSTLPPPGPVGPDVRARIEAAIERMIALLDSVDGDPDAEPYLAAASIEECYGEHAPTDDREQEDDFEGGTDDNGIADLGGLLEQGLRLSYEHVE